MKPHDTYAHAVMDALGDLIDPADTWTAYDSDNGEVMLMETVITIDPDRAQAAGWPHGLFLQWDQITGWQWSDKNASGHGNHASPLAWPAVCTPDTVTQAVTALLAPGAPQGLPVEGQQRETPGSIPDDLTQILAELADTVTDQDEAADIAATVRALAAYR